MLRSTGPTRQNECWLSYELSLTGAGIVAVADTLPVEAAFQSRRIRVRGFTPPLFLHPASQMVAMPETLAVPSLFEPTPENKKGQGEQIPLPCPQESNSLLLAHPSSCKCRYPNQP
jgi:hypothetical protein